MESPLSLQSVHSLQQQPSRYFGPRDLKQMILNAGLHAPPNEFVSPADRLAASPLPLAGMAAEFVPEGQNNKPMPPGQPQFGRPLTYPVQTRGRDVYHADYKITPGASACSRAQENQLMDRATNPIIDSLDKNHCLVRDGVGGSGGPLAGRLQEPI